MAKEQGANKLLTNFPPCILFLEQGRELMREAGEPMKCGIFDFYKVFSRAFGEVGDVVTTPIFEKQVYTQLTHRSLTIIPDTG